MLFTEEWRWFEDILNGLSKVSVPNPTFTFKEEEGKLVCELDLPGVKKEDLIVEVSHGRILITGKRGDSQIEEIIRVNTHKYDVETGKASLADGVLTLVFEPKEAPTKTLLVVK